MATLLFALFYHVNAESLDRVYGKRLARARTGQVARLVADYEDIRELRLACKLELREKRFPFACFVTLRREDEWRLRSGSERARVLARLEVRCRRATAALTLPRDDADLGWLTPTCRDRVREGRKVRDYRAEEGEWSGS